MGASMPKVYPSLVTGGEYFCLQPAPRNEMPASEFARRARRTLPSAPTPIIPASVWQRRESIRVKLIFPRLAAISFLALVRLAPPTHAQQAAPTESVLPNPTLTPGDVLDVTLADIQVRGYSSKVRDVPISVKRQVYASYGIERWNKGEYEMDHLVSLSLGGSNSKRNLWPESYLTEPWNAHTKDQLEYKLLTLVRSGQIDLHTAQREMATDWVAAYRKYVSPEPLMDKRRAGMPARNTGGAFGDESTRRDEDPDTETTPTSSAQGAAAADGQVWVNTKSGVIWKPGTEYYGKTKAGKYMSSADALAAGYHYAR